MNTSHVWRRKRDLSRKVTEERNSDFRLRTSADVSGGRCLRRPRGACIVASRGLELEVTIRGSGTLAASALARHCEATGVSLPREWRAATDETNGTCGTNGTVGIARGTVPSEFSLSSTAAVHHILLFGQEERSGPAHLRGLTNCRVEEIERLTLTKPSRGNRYLGGILRKINGVRHWENGHLARS